MQGTLTNHAPVPCSTEGGATKCTLSTRQALPGRTMLSTFSQTLSSRRGLPTQSAHLQGDDCTTFYWMSPCLSTKADVFGPLPIWFWSCCRPMRGSDPLASPAAGEATSPGNWMLNMPSASSSTPFSPVQPVYELKSRTQRHQMQGEHASHLKHRVLQIYSLASSFLQRLMF